MAIRNKRWCFTRSPFLFFNSLWLRQPHRNWLLPYRFIWLQVAVYHRKDSWHLLFFHKAYHLKSRLTCYVTDIGKKYWSDLFNSSSRNLLLSLSPLLFSSQLCSSIHSCTVFSWTNRLVILVFAIPLLRIPEIWPFLYLFRVRLFIAFWITQ